MNKPVSFELAKLLKEKQFSWETGDEDDYEKGRHGYFRHKSGNIAAISYYHFDTNHNGVQWTNLNVPAPTIADVVMWLYDKHGIWIVVNPHKGEDDLGKPFMEFDPEVWSFTNECIFHDTKLLYFNSPTEAYEAAIEYTLKHLI